MSVQPTGIHIEGASVWDVDNYDLCRLLLAPDVNFDLGQITELAGQGADHSAAYHPP